MDDHWSLSAGQWSIIDRLACGVYRHGRTPDGKPHSRTGHDAGTWGQCADRQPFAAIQNWRIPEAGLC